MLLYVAGILNYNYITQKINIVIPLIGFCITFTAKYKSLFGSSYSPY
jgi:hypothetical protein